MEKNDVINGISVEEVEDCMALWKPVVDEYEAIIKSVNIIKDKHPELKNLDSKQFATDLVTESMNNYFNTLASSPSPW